MTTTADPRLKTTRVPLDSLTMWEGNARRGVVSKIKESMRVNGVFHPLDVQTNSRRIIAGNHRYKALLELHAEHPEDERWGPDVDVILHDVNDKRALKMHLADNKTADDATWDEGALIEQLQQAVEDESLEGTGFDDDDLQDLLDGLEEDETLGGGEDTQPEHSGVLTSRFGMPPFTILDTRTGPWRDRSRAWKSLGIQSEVGRGGELAYQTPFNLYRNWMSVRNTIEKELGHKPTDDEVLAHPLAKTLTRINEGGGTSIFDPVLCELVYRWFSSPGDAVIDPWAGGSVRGIVACRLGREYTGIDLRPEQVAANRAQVPLVTMAAPGQDGEDGPGAELDARPTPEWHVGDSTEVLTTLEPESYHMAIGCPPYYDLERYSDDPKDLSTMTPEDFDRAMARNIKALERTLAPDSFAVMVVASVRGKDGLILDMRRCMTDAFAAAGMHLTNDAVLLNHVGNGGMRASRPFLGARTLTRVHQEVLVYVKGDRRAAAARLGEVDVTDTLKALEELAEADGAEDALDPQEEQE